MTGANAANTDLWEEMMGMDAPSLRAALAGIAGRDPVFFASQAGILAHQLKRGSDEGRTLASLCVRNINSTLDALSALTLIQAAALHTAESDESLHFMLADKFRALLDGLRETDMRRALDAAALARAKLPKTIPISFEAADFMLENVGREEAAAMMVGLARDGAQLSEEQQEKLVLRIAWLSQTFPYDAAAAMKEYIESETPAVDNGARKKALELFPIIRDSPAVLKEVLKREYGMDMPPPPGVN